MLPLRVVIKSGTRREKKEKYAALDTFYDRLRRLVAITQCWGPRQRKVLRYTRIRKGNRVKDSKWGRIDRDDG